MEQMRTFKILRYILPSVSQVTRTQIPFFSEYAQSGGDRGGNKLELKELGCFNSETALVLYFMQNEGNGQAILSELIKILAAARDLEKDEDKDFLYGDKEIPIMTTRIQNPKVPGQDTSIYEDWHWRDANKRKAIHIECAAEEVKHLQRLVEIAKRRNLVAMIWGK